MWIVRYICLSRNTRVFQRRNKFKLGESKIDGMNTHKTKNEKKRRAQASKNLDFFTFFFYRECEALFFSLSFCLTSHSKNRFSVSDHGFIVICRFFNRNVLRLHTHTHTYFRFGCWTWIMNEKCKVKLNIV